MSKRAIFSVSADGADITGNLRPYVISIRVSDRAGASSDAATIELDDREGQIVFPRPGALISISLGWEGDGIAVVFSGKADGIRSRRSRGQGQTMTITAKGIDSAGSPKAPQQRHFDDTSIKDMLTKAGKDAGVTEIKVDDEFASIIRPYEAMDDESFIAFGQRLAKELGGTFKVRGATAVLVKRSGGTSPSGASLPVVNAAVGDNLHSWDIEPFIGRPRFKKARARYYDQKEAKWKEVEVETEVEGEAPTLVDRFAVADEDRAKQETGSRKTDIERAGGEGTVVIEGNIAACAEGTCIVSGARPGIDGTYRIDSVDHEYSRGSGFTTSLTLKQPHGDAGKDSRSTKSRTGSQAGEQDFSLPADPELG
ncbi:hypothetical protein AKG11_03735 [Shinella sp. SUS2]|uniref:phage late control D family protein n=1 Tax=unclassified Shinella TaxID=2643062 RepID=UPI0006830EE4|nr:MULTISPECIES: contractile injection system protein, VgrG/Pvc8 family [unclassified Shinella]KNY18253.1 hypothetical protein AKG11_03735 [Shinella sp. SUS2]KOC77448.1 hypothetical protein AKG10_01205 [Shinella sp. GWS1]